MPNTINVVTSKNLDQSLSNLLASNQMLAMESNGKTIVNISKNMALSENGPVIFTKLTEMFGASSLRVFVVSNVEKDGNETRVNSFEWNADTTSPSLKDQLAEKKTEFKTLADQQKSLLKDGKDFSNDEYATYNKVTNEKVELQNSINEMKDNYGGVISHFNQIVEFYLPTGKLTKLDGFALKVVQEENKETPEEYHNEIGNVQVLVATITTELKGGKRRKRHR